MASYLDHYTSLFLQLERMGKDAAIPDSHEAPILLTSIDITCSLGSTAATLRTKEPNELAWEYVATTFINECNARKLLSSSLLLRGKQKNWRKLKKKSRQTV